MTRRNERWAAYGVAFAVALAPGWAAGDVIPPDVDACRALNVGAACGGGMSGVAVGRCQQSTCTRIDYAGWDRDASSTPPTMQYACVRCTSGAGDSGTTPPSSGSSGGCSVVTNEAGRSVGPWILAGLVGAAFLVRRRKG